MNSPNVLLSMLGDDWQVWWEDGKRVSDSTVKGEEIWVCESGESELMCQHCENLSDTNSQIILERMLIFRRQMQRPKFWIQGQECIRGHVKKRRKKSVYILNRYYSFHFGSTKGLCYTVYHNRRLRTWHVNYMAWFLRSLDWSLFSLCILSALSPNMFLSIPERDINSNFLLCVQGHLAKDDYELQRVPSSMWALAVAKIPP